MENTVSVDACRLATFNVFNGLFLDVAGAKRAVSPGAMTDASVPANNYRSQPQYGSMVRSTTIFFCKSSATVIGTFLCEWYRSVRTE